MSVKNILRRSTDVDQSSPHAITTRGSLQTNFERPLSEYDNIQSGRTDFCLAGIHFRFTESFPASSSMSSTENEVKPPTNTTTAPKYENVLETLQLRNKKQQESDQQVKTNENGSRSVMSVAKSSFFGLNDSQKATNMDDDIIDKLIEDIGNAKIVPTERVQYENIEEPKVQNVSATSSASGSSSTTVTPSSSPTRQDRPHSSRKNSEGSNRSKSPKFMLPEQPSSPSQSVYMSTTVPQNIKGQNIIGRHKPTRQSLRHSRHIVTSKHFQGPVHSNALNIRHAWLAKFVLILKIVTGISILGLGGWICLFANSTPIQQNPFWSGLILILSGLLGLYMLSFRRTRSKLKANFFWFLKMNASVIILMSVFLTTLAFIYASFHYISLGSDNKKCFPENVFINSSSCICVFNVNPETVLTRADLENVTDTNGHIELPEERNIVHFRDLSCNELPTWSHILLTSMIMNFVGLVLSVCFMTQFIFGCKRRRKKPYVSVRNGA